MPAKAAEGKKKKAKEGADGKVAAPDAGKKKKKAKDDAGEDDGDLGLLRAAADRAGAEKAASELASKKQELESLEEQLEQIGETEEVEGLSEEEHEKRKEARKEQDYLMGQIKLMKADIARIDEEGAVHPEGGADGGEEPFTAAKTEVVLGFQATPVPPKPPPSLEEMGNPFAAQQKSAERRRRGADSQKLFSLLWLLVAFDRAFNFENVRQEQELEARQREPHEGNLITARDGTGTTPYSHRLRHQVQTCLGFGL